MRSFKSPLGTVAFSSGNAPKSIIDIIPGAFSTENPAEPRKLNWQQPIISWKKKKRVATGIQPGDMYVNALVSPPYNPMPTLVTPLIAARGKTYRILDKFTKKKKSKKAKFPKKKAAEGGNYNVTLPPSGT